MSKPTVAVLGLGAMGSRMAGRLLAQGYPVVVYNRSPDPVVDLVDRGAEAADTPRQAAREADVILAMVRDDAASRELWLEPRSGAVAGLRSRTMAVECSTLTPAWARQLGEAVEAAGAAFLDAPVVGSRPHAATGTLTFLVGGAPEGVDRVRPILDALGSTVHRVGPVGSGMTMKLAVNAMFALQAAGLAELLTTVTRSGIERSTATEVLNSLPTASPAAARLATVMASREFAPNFPIALVAKDLGYAAALARGAGVDAPVVEAAGRSFSGAVDRGFGDLDITGILQFLESAAERTDP